MSDDRTNRRPGDAQRINVNEDYEVRYWAKELGVSREKLVEVIRHVGPMARDVRAAIQQK